ncbi:MAG: hypothetical protein ABIS03_05320 [Gemmatimonadaceae bacterium]
MKRNFSAALLAFSLTAASSALAQTASDQIAAGDRAYASMNAAGALSAYERALSSNPVNYEALWKASRSAIDLGSHDTDKARRNKLYSKGEQYARTAVASKPGDAQGHFAVARALGKTALGESARGRVKYAAEIRSAALECLRLDPGHAGCLHVMGMWNAEVMRLNGVARLVAKKILGGTVLGTASWKDAVRYMEAAVAAEPDVIVHHVDLGGIYADVNQLAKARAEYETSLRLPIADLNDAAYKAQVRSALKSM